MILDLDGTLCLPVSKQVPPPGLCGTGLLLSWHGSACAHVTLRAGCRAIGQGAIRGKKTGSPLDTATAAAQRRYFEPFFGLIVPEEFDADLRTTTGGSAPQQAGVETAARRRDGPPPPLVGHSLERQVGNHTILELWGADAAVLNDEARLRKAMSEAAEAGRLVVLQEAFHSFEVRLTFRSFVLHLSLC